MVRRGEARRAEAGFALMEVLVSVAIFLVVLSGAFALVRGVDAALVRQLDLESQGADLDRQLAAWRGDAATAHAVFAPSENEVDFFAFNNAADGGAAANGALFERKTWLMSTSGLLWRYVYDPATQTLRRVDYNASGLMGVRMPGSDAIDTNASYPPLNGVTGFSVRTISAARLNDAGNPYAAAVTGMPTRAHAVDLGNGMTGGNQVTEITVATAQGARRVHLLAGTMPSGFTLQGAALYKGIVYRLDLTHRFLGGLAGRTHVEIRGVVYVSYDHWRTRAPWCDYGIYIDKSQIFLPGDLYEQPAHMAYVCQHFNAPLPQAGPGGSLPSNVKPWIAPDGFYDGMRWQKPR